MTHIAIDIDTVRPGFHGAIHLPARLRAVLQLFALGRHQRSLTAALQFADARVQADLGLVNRREHQDWFAAFLASQAAR